ncbi:MAG: hypothetical protein Q7U20_11280 [Caulobacter sp.]|nr:hypothetical protein [Caulobacter sp.]
MRALSWLVLAAVLTVAPAFAQVSPNGPPPPGAAGRGLSRLQGADGVVFEAMEDDGARHKLTGFVCPAELEGFKRTRLIQSAGGHYVACKFSRGESWFTVYLTRLPGRSGNDMFATHVLEAQKVAPSTGPAAPPLAPGFPPLPAFGSFWRSDTGGVDGLWMSQIGDWYITLRVTYAPEDEAAVRAFAEALYKQVHDQIAAPEI